MRFKSKAYLKAMYDKEVAIISAKNIPLVALSCESTDDYTKKYIWRAVSDRLRSQTCKRV